MNLGLSFAPTQVPSKKNSVTIYKCKRCKTELSDVDVKTIRKKLCSKCSRDLQLEYFRERHRNGYTPVIQNPTKCGFCGKIFTPKKKSDFCSARCSIRKLRGVNPNVLNRDCRECGKPIKNPKFRKYDSIICRNIARHRSILLKLQENLRNG